MSYSIKPISPVLGAEVVGLDLKNPLEAREIEKLSNALYEHQVLVFRNQNLTPKEQINACVQFGEPELHPMNSNTCEYPEMTYVSNVTEGGVPMGYAGPQFELWHNDMCYYPEVIKMAFLYAEEIPEKNGNTLFADMYKAYDELPEDIKQEVEGKNAVFGSGHNLMKRCQARGYELVIAEDDIKPDVIHPVIHTHPETMRKAIFVNWTHTDKIIGLSQERSDELLNKIYEHCLQRKYIYSHDYQPGDMIVWDNFSVLHTGSGGEIDGRRVMRRVAIRGCKPFYSDSRRRNQKFIADQCVN